MWTGWLKAVMPARFKTVPPCKHHMLAKFETVQPFKHHLPCKGQPACALLQTMVAKFEIVLPFNHHIALQRAANRPCCPPSLGTSGMRPAAVTPAPLSRTRMLPLSTSPIQQLRGEERGAQACMQTEATQAARQSAHSASCTPSSAIFHQCSPAQAEAHMCVGLSTCFSKGQMPACAWAPALAATPQPPTCISLGGSRLHLPGW